MPTLSVKVVQYPIPLPEVHGLAPPPACAFTYPAVTRSLSEVEAESELILISVTACPPKLK